MNVNDIFEELAATPGKNDKLAIMKANSNNADFREACRLALDPFTLFYTKTIPAYVCEDSLMGMHSLSEAMKRLSALSTREVTGTAAQDFLAGILSSCRDTDAKVIERIILKDLRCGVDTAVNKVWKGLVMDWPCMLATSFNQKKAEKFKFPALAQLKLDGMRFNAIVEDGDVTFRSRNGKPLNIADPDLAVQFRYLAAGDDVVFDGELLCRGDHGDYMDRKTGNGILNKATKNTQSRAEGKSVCAVLWDRIALADFRSGISNEPYTERFRKTTEALSRLTDTSRIDVVWSKEVQSLAEAEEIFEDFLAKGEEGIILKDPNVIWKDARSAGQLKFKAELDCDLEVIEWVEGRARTKYEGQMGKLICASSDRKVIVSVGGGWSDEQRATITPDIVGSIIAVRYNERIKDKDRPDVDSLFLPRVIEIREDKSEADSSAAIK